MSGLSSSHSKRWINVAGGNGGRGSKRREPETRKRNDESLWKKTRRDDSSSSSGSLDQNVNCTNTTNIKCNLMKNPLPKNPNLYSKG